jgi:hypothetical protein
MAKAVLRFHAPGIPLEEQTGQTSFIVENP